MNSTNDLRKEKREGWYKHGGTGTRLYSCWATMKYRCHNTNAQGYKRYGGRGINVCDEWANSFLQFKEWALNNGYADNLTIDRIDNNKGYSPENCRWATAKEQGRNRGDNRLLTLNGETKTLIEWAEIAGIGVATLHSRLFKHGWSLEKSLTTPPWGSLTRKPNLSQMKAVHQCDKDGNILATFESLSSAAKATGTSSTTISRVLHGKKRTTGGYYWKFATEGSMNSEFI